MRTPLRPVDIDALKAGDEVAFLSAWQELQPRLLRFLRGLGAGPDAEDVASTTWLEVIRHLHRFDGDEQDFVRWLFTIARNRRVDALRRVSRRPEVLEPVVGTPLASGEIDPAELSERRVTTGAALALIRTLTPDQAEVILLRVLGELEVDAVAGIVGKSPGAVRVLTHRGLRRLAETCAGHDDLAQAWNALEGAS